MTSTSSTADSGTLHSERTVYVARNSARDGWHEDTSQNMARPHVEKRKTSTVEKAWPPTATVELGATLVKRRVASSAGIDPGRVIILVLPRARSLGALQTEHPELHAGSLL